MINRAFHRKPTGKPTGKLTGTLAAFTGLLLAGVGLPVTAAEYTVDPGHSFIEFRIKHLGYSWLYGRFNDMSGELSYDAKNPGASSISLDIKPASVDTNHAERDKHIRNADFLNVGKFKEAGFKSTGYSGDADGGTLNGDLTFHGVTLPVAIKIKKIGEGKDPWGGYRAGFEGTLVLNAQDFGMNYNLGPNGWIMEFDLGIEGIRK